MKKTYREFLAGFASEENIKKLCGVYRGICESNAKAFAAGQLDNIMLEQRSNTKGYSSVSYLGTLRAGEYGNRIRMTAFHVMAEKGTMVQAMEVGNCFYISWYQGFHDEKYVKAMRDIMKEAGMNSVSLDRVE